MIIAGIVISSYMVFVSAVGAIGWSHQQRKTDVERHIDYLRDTGDHKELFRYIHKNFGMPTIVEHQPTGQLFFLN